MSILGRIAAAFRPEQSSTALVLRPEAEPERGAPDLFERAIDPGAIGGALSSGIYRNEASSRRGQTELIELYQVSPWLRAVSHKVASGVGSVQWQLFARKSVKSARSPNAPADYVRDERILNMKPLVRHAAVLRAIEAGEMQEFHEHPFLRLLERPNPNMSGVAARMVTTVHLDLLGDAFWVIDVDAEQRPVKFWPVPSHWVKSIPTREEPFWRIDFPAFQGEVPADRMLWFRDVDPGDPYGRGAGLGMALGDELDIDEAAGKTVKGFFENTAMPPLLVSLEGAKQETVDRARIKWEKALKGFKRAFQTFFTGAKINVQRLDTSFKEMALVELRKAERDVVVQTWGMPPEKLAIIENSNRSTIDAADLIYAKEVLLPRLELMRSEFQRIVTRWDARLIVDYVSPVPQDMDRRRGVVTSLPAIFKIDEQRALADLPPLPDREGEGYLLDPGKIYVPQLRVLAQGSPIFGYHLSAGLLTNNEMRAKLGLPATSEPWGEQRTTGFYTPPFVQAAPLAGPPEPDAVEFEPGTPQAETEAERRARLGLPVLYLPPRPGPPTDRAAVARASALSVKNLKAVLGAVDVNSLARHMQPQIEKMVEAFGEETLKALETTKRFDMQDPKVDDHIRELLQDRIGRLMNGTTRENLRATMTGWDGDDNEELVKSVRGVFDDARIERSQAIAQTEGQRTKEFATHLAMVQSEIVERKEWVAVGDGRTREAHLDMDGQTVGINEPFRVPSGKWAGAEAQTPGSFGIAALDINCRCVSAPTFDLDPDEGGEEEERSARRVALLDAGIVPRGASADERAAMWRAQDTKLRRWENRLADAAAAGFDDQEQLVVDALLKVLG